MTPIMSVDSEGKTRFTFKFGGNIEDWVIPAGVLKVRIQAFGAIGGSGFSGTHSYSNYGKISVAGDFTVVPGQKLRVLVGGRGADYHATGGSSTTRGGGGGGGTYVVLEDGSPLIIAGGVGGSGSSLAGIVGESVLMSNQGDSSDGGSGGNGSGGGGGLTGSGSVGGSRAGKSFVQGGHGGIHENLTVGNAQGFGGGGVTSTGFGGGGGGYKGGDGGSAATTVLGRNGTSYNVGENQLNQGIRSRFNIEELDARDTNGVVIITVLEYNLNPIITLNTPNNATLYENDTFKIDGSAKDVDVGDIVNAKYQINAGTVRALVVDISTGANIPFNKQLTFKGGILYDGATAVTGALTEGTAHQLKVWSEDDKGGKSAEQVRTFYAVPNRAPTLTVNPFDVQSGMIDADKVTLTGESSDLDSNDVTVAYKLNTNAAVQIHSGPAGPWSFDLPLSALKVGENTIIVEVTDTYNFKSSKTIKLNKHANLTPLELSVVRCIIVPPSGAAQGVLLWIQRDEGQVISAEISMTTGSEQEQFVPMTLSNTAPITPIEAGIVEDEFLYQAASEKENIMLKLNLSNDKPITLITGVLS